MASDSYPARSYSSAGRITAKLFLSFLLLSPVTVAVANSPPTPNQADAAVIPDHIFAPGPAIGGDGNPSGRAGGTHEFSLRHIMHHGTYKYPEMLRRLDVHPETLVAAEEDGRLGPRPVYTARSLPQSIKRLADRSRSTVEARLLNHRRGGPPPPDLVSAWVVDQIPQPNVTDKDTVLTLAKIAANAYVEVERTEDWLEVGTPYNRTDDFGWEGDGLRGHIFADRDNSTVIIGLKGTSAALFDGPETTTNDKINDNLLFSCCCARVSYWWKTVCDCYSGTAFTCDRVCLKKELTAENRYYRAALQLYYNVTQLYPASNIWVAGHSLGGSLSSLIAQTYGLPAVAFEAPGEALASERLGLHMPPGGARQAVDTGIHHFGHTADPVFMGACNGPTSPCSIGGYAMESRCHVGMECVYDVVSDKGWRMGLGYHRIQGVIKDVIMVYDDVPKCTFEPNCVDCYNWKFVSGNDSSTTTTTTTCLTPGWWGCRDITTTAATSTTTATTTTATCSHYGWFGNCLDPTPTDSGSPTVTPTATSTTSTMPTETCSHYGWFGGCLDPEPTPSSPPSSSSPSPPYTSPATPTPTNDERLTRKCRERALWGLGWCRGWNAEL